MKKSHLFSAIAEFYDYSMRENCDYVGWSQYVVESIKTYAPTARYGIDMACGSGFFTRALKKASYDAVGVDISREMLTSAQNITAKEGLYIDYIVGDMLNFKFFKKVDFITAINDAINYIPDNKLEKVFKNLANCLTKGGVLHFDVSSEYKLKNIIANNTFCEDDEDFSYIWFNKLFEDKVAMEMSVFTKESDGKYKKIESETVEYIHTLNRLCDALECSNFEVLKIAGDEGADYHEKSHRINITAVRR